MDNVENKNITMFNNKPIKSLISNDKNYLNPEIISMRQDLLFFKNDILKDMRLLEDKIFVKITEQM